MSGAEERLGRIGRVVAAVVRQAVADARAEGVLLREDGAENGLAREWCAGAVGAERVFTRGSGARLLEAHAASKTTLLLMPVPRAELLPLGDLYGSELLELTASWSPPAEVRELARLAGGPAALDAALRRWADERRRLDLAVQDLPAGAAAALARALHANRFARAHCGLVPKLTGRTLGIDLWE